MFFPLRVIQSTSFPLRGKVGMGVVLPHPSFQSHHSGFTPA